MVGVALLPAAPALELPAVLPVPVPEDRFAARAANRVAAEASTFEALGAPRLVGGTRADTALVIWRARRPEGEEEGAAVRGGVLSVESRELETEGMVDMEEPPSGSAG